jgi:hypothetical protein
MNPESSFSEAIHIRIAGRPSGISARIPEAADLAGEEK